MTTMRYPPLGGVALEGQNVAYTWWFPRVLPPLTLMLAPEDDQLHF